MLPLIIEANKSYKISKRVHAWLLKVVKDTVKNVKHVMTLSGFSVIALALHQFEKIFDTDTDTLKRHLT